MQNAEPKPVQIHALGESVRRQIDEQLVKNLQFRSLSQRELQRPAQATATRRREIERPQPPFFIDNALFERPPTALFLLENNAPNGLVYLPKLRESIRSISSIQPT